MERRKFLATLALTPALQAARSVTSKQQLTGFVELHNTEPLYTVFLPNDIDLLQVRTPCRIGQGSYEDLLRFTGRRNPDALSSLAVKICGENGQAFSFGRTWRYAEMWLKDVPGRVYVEFLTGDWKLTPMTRLRYDKGELARKGFWLLYGEEVNL